MWRDEVNLGKWIFNREAKGEKNVLGHFLGPTDYLFNSSKMIQNVPDLK